MKWSEEYIAGKAVQKNGLSSKGLKTTSVGNSIQSLLIEYSCAAEQPIALNDV